MHSNIIWRNRKGKIKENVFYSCLTYGEHILSLKLESLLFALFYFVCSCFCFLLVCFVCFGSHLMFVS